MSNIQDDEYFTFVGEEDGKPLIFLGLSNADEISREVELPNQINITWQYDSEDNSGMPSEIENNIHVVFEEALDHLDINEVGRLALIITGNNSKNWYWYVGDVGNWLEKFNVALAGHSLYPIEIEHTFDPDWSFIKSFLTVDFCQK